MSCDAPGLELDDMPHAQASVVILNEDGETEVCEIVYKKSRVHKVIFQFLCGCTMKVISLEDLDITNLDTLSNEELLEMLEEHRRQK